MKKYYICYQVSYTAPWDRPKSWVEESGTFEGNNSREARKRFREHYRARKILVGRHISTRLERNR